ncbi:DUF2971 domain-containing protein [Thermodesulfobacteriota bacterium]
MDLKRIKLYKKDELPPIIYHYTSQHGLLEIIKSKCFWATDIHYLNDFSEYDYSYNIVRRLLINLEVVFLMQTGSSGDNIEIGANTQIDHPERKALDKTVEVFESFTTSTSYLCSFSEEGDLLSQWRGYCPNGNGFSIGFDTEKLMKIMNKYNYNIVQCIYEVQDQERIVKQLIDELFSTLKKIGYEKEDKIFDEIIEFYLAFHLIAPRLKDKSFKEEKEWRFCFSFIVKPAEKKILYREGKSFIIPYDSVPIADSNNEIPIDRIIISPTPHKELSHNSLLEFLRQHKLNNIKIIDSEIPFRNW